MSKVLKALGAMASEKTPEAIKAMVSAGLVLARARLDGDALDAVEDGLIRLGAIAPELAHLAPEGVIVLLTLWGYGEPDAAALKYLETHAGFHDRRQAHLAASAKALQAGVDRVSLWGGVESALGALGKGVGALIPILMSVV